MPKKRAVKEQVYKYIYGPVYSWRLGDSLGIDPIGTKEKTCNFNCIYCQLGKTAQFKNERKIFVPTKEILKEIAHIPSYLKIDCLTFSGRGEPTLAKNLGEMIEGVKGIKGQKVAVITNSSLLHDHGVQKDLLSADIVLAKLDACSQRSFDVIGRPLKGTRFQMIVDGIKRFKTIFKGKLALQIMLMEENKSLSWGIAQMAREIGADEVQLDTPLRPSTTKPLPKGEMDLLRVYFKDLPVVSVYDSEARESFPFDETETIKRHGNYKACQN